MAIASSHSETTSSAARALYGAQQRVLLWVCALSALTYLDRVCFGVAAKHLKSDLGLDNDAELKWAFTAFAIAYSLFEIPSGWLGDAIGPRRALLRIVAWWSLFTAATGLVGYQVAGITLGGLYTLFIVRFLFGAGEAGAYPNITRALHNWFPTERWATAQGYVWMSGRLMGGLTPLIWAALVTGTAWTPALLNWRGAFLGFGVLGLVWCVGFGLKFRDTPRGDARWRDTPELLAHVPEHHDSHELPWRKLLANRTLWPLSLMYFCINYGWYFHITYLPLFLRQRFDVGDDQLVGAIYLGGPLLVGSLGCFCGGKLADWLARRTGNARRVRIMIGIVGQSFCAACWVVAMFAPNVHVFCAAISLSAFANDMTMASAWATCQDIGGNHAAVTAATMNTVGTGGAAMAGWLTGTIVERALSQQATGLGVAVTALPADALHTATLDGYYQSLVTFAGACAVAALLWAAAGWTLRRRGVESSASQ
ncbi:MAG: MFS transporter [Planctomycetes bacterium]|nr:MFS transporter [Planctomycetota bacterium]